MDEQEVKKLGAALTRLEKLQKRQEDLTVELRVMVNALIAIFLKSSGPVMDAATSARRQKEIEAVNKRAEEVFGKAGYGKPSPKRRK